MDKICNFDIVINTCLAEMNLTPLDDVLDKHFGKVGTPERDAFESNVDDALHAFRLGEAIKEARIEQNLTHLRTVDAPPYYKHRKYRVLHICQ